ncbi:MAG: hypothetical protein DRN15_01950 [Thermoprotei archaeon]|nr:MAG: hypothetical protein DRM97_08475 [Thermoprotei archaeon]RLF24725.1 MAG: hypothetical protein DRN15_01950 [Thermoprotei archaeon]
MDDRLYRLVQTIARYPKDKEYALVLFEDGYISSHLYNTQELAVIPVYNRVHGRAIAVVHTHPIPRTAPSIADLKTLAIMSRYGTPAHLVTVFSYKDRVKVTVYTAKRRIDPEELKEIMMLSSHYEHIPLLSDKQVREQAYKLRKYGIVVERYDLMLKD